jgi:NTP pyrophosphatase (non-canonical NTP hydrolase)
VSTAGGSDQAVKPLDLPGLVALLRRFVRERDWEQFHTPKNLVMALSGEVGELTELFQWLTPEQSQAVMQDPKTAPRVRDELADVVFYCLRLVDVLGVDLEAAIRAKMQKNAEKYPVALSRGKATKYDQLGQGGDE